MEFYNTTFFIRNDSPELRFEFRSGGKNGPGWLQLYSGVSPFISMLLPDDHEARSAVLAGLRSSLNKAIDEAEAVAAALKAEDLPALDAKAADPEPLRSTG